MIKVVKLVTGEEVIGDLEIDGGLITIEQIGGNFDLERDTKFSTIENWMPFFTNIKY